MNLLMEDLIPMDLMDLTLTEDLNLPDLLDLLNRMDLLDLAIKWSPSTDVFSKSKEAVFGHWELVCG
jgi:hypothetical protein